MSNLLTVGKVSQLLGYSVQHVRLLIRQQKISGKKIGRDWLVDASDIKRPGLEAQRMDR